MSQAPESDNKKPLITGSISRWIMGVLVAAISVLYLDSRSDRQFLRDELKDQKELTAKEKERADRNAQGWIQSEISGKERAEKVSDWLRDKREQNDTP